MFTIIVSETTDGQTTEAFRSTRESVNLSEIFAAALKPGRKKRSDSGQQKKANPQPELLNPATGEPQQSNQNDK